jgi:hypothetical protein
MELSLPPDQVQCGDLLRLEEGDRVAADAASINAGFDSLDKP